MNDNYLWDRTGEPDKEIQELEELLGELRYQPRPLDIPANITIGRKRSFFLPVTIAAAIIMIAVLSALWFQFNQKAAPTPSQAKRDTVLAPTPDASDEKQSASAPEKNPLVAKDEPGSQKPRRQLNRNLIAKNERPVEKRTFEPQLTPQELAEKEQVLVALRLVSAKLNIAQRKTVGGPPTNIIRNQHKIG